MAEIDSLELKIIADATSASASIDRFVASLERLSVAMAGIQNANGLDQVATGISNLGVAMEGVASIDSRKFSTLANNISRLGAIGGAQLSTAANGMFDMVVALDSINGTAPETSVNVANLANAVGRLGGANIERAVINIPVLTTALREMLVSLSTAPQISQNVIEMTNALANLASQAKNMQATTTRVSTGFTNLGKSAKESSRTFGGLAARFGKFYATFFLLIRGIKALWRSTESAMDYVETFNYYSVALDKVGKTTARAFGEMGENDAEAYTEKFTKKLKELNKKMTGYIVGDRGELINTDSIGLGLDPEKLMNFQAQIMGITNSVGLLGDASTSTAKALSMLSADLSSLTNTDLEQVMNNLRSGLIGQSRALYKYGIDVTSATLKQYALAYGIEKSVTEMSQSEKMQLRMLAILDQSRIAWGDQARTINTVANQYRILKQQVSNLGRIIGNLFLPIIQKVLPYINAFIILLQRLFTMLGLKLWGDSWLKDLNNDITSIGGGADDIEDLSDSLDDAADSAKKLKGQLLGIDELNVLNTKDGGANSKLGGIGGIDLSGAIGDALAEYESAWDEALKNAQNKAEKIANAIENFFKKAFDVPDTVEEKVEKIKNNVRRILESTGRVWGSEEVRQKLREFGDQAIETAEAIRDSVAEGLTSWGVGVTGGIADAKEDLEEFDKVTLSSTIQSFTDLLQITEEVNVAAATLSKVYESKGFQKIVEIFTKLSDVLGKIAFDSALGFFKDLLGFFTKPVTENADKIEVALEHISNIIGNLLAPLETLLDLISESYDGYENSWIHKLFVEGTNANTEKFGELLDLINQILEKLETSSEKVKEWSDNFKTLFDESENPFEFITNAFEEVKNSFSTKQNEFMSKIKAIPTEIAYQLGRAYGKIHEWGEKVGVWIRTDLPVIVAKIITVFKDLPERLRKKLDEARDKFDDWRRSVDDWIKNDLPYLIIDIANAFMDLPNKLYEVGKNAIIGLWNGITDWWNEKTSKVKNFTDSIANAFKRGFDEHSPSKVFFQIGAYATEGLKLGIESLYDDTLRSVRDFTGGLTEVPKLNYDLSANINPTTAKIEASADIATALKPVMLEAMSMALDSSETTVNVVLEGDTDKIFKVVKDKSQDFTRRTGLPAFS